MQIHVHTEVCWLPKHGHAEEEYEDASAVGEPRLPFRCAMADGATEAAFSGIWAWRLVSGWIEDSIATPAELVQRLGNWQRQWQEGVDRASGSRPWYAAAKAEQGAFATFLGLHIAEDGTWRALAVGDCCLFHLNPAGLRLSWPFKHPGQFTHTPALIGSRLPLNPQGILEQSGHWDPSDTFVLTTDALAAWLLRRGPAAVLSQLEPDFEAAVEQARYSGDLRNDDVTALRITLSDAKE